VTNLLNVKIQYCSDLHLEFPENELLLKQAPLEIAGDVLILSGDIVPFRDLEKYSYFFDFLSDNYKSIYWVPGNHEYYGSDASERKGAFNEQIRSNVFLVNNTVVKEGNVRLIFSTLWSHIHPENEYTVSMNLNDFKVIKFRNRRFTSSHFNFLHHISKTFLREALSKTHNGPTIVATHYVPTKLNYPSQYKNSPYNDAFVVELFDMITDLQPDYWIYGHHHSNIPEFKIGRTSLICNQLGYVTAGEHGDFNQCAALTID
jgi:predicted phosphohydrolase